MPNCSLETNGEGVSEQPSQELWHSLNFDELVVVDIEMGPGVVEVLIKISGSLIIVILEMSMNDLVGNLSGGVFIEEEVTGWSSGIVLHFEGVVLDQRVHKSIVSLLSVLLWNFSIVSLVGIGTIEVWNVVLEFLKLDVLLALWLLGFFLIIVVLLLFLVVIALDLFVVVLVIVVLFFVLGLEESPVVVEMAGESGVWVCVSWHWTSDVWLWVLLDTSLQNSPVIVEMAAESAIWVCVSRHWASNVWLWVFLGISLEHGPVVVEVAGEGAIGMGISWHWSSDVWLRVLLDTSLQNSPVVVEMAGESGVWMSVSWHWSSNVWLWVLVSGEFDSADFKETEKASLSNSIFH